LIPAVYEKGIAMPTQSSILVTIAFGALSAHAFGGDGFSISTYSIAGGAGLHESGPYTLSGSTGQPVAGADSMGGGFSIVSGFPQSTTGTSPCPADLNGDGVLNFFDVSTFLNAYTAMLPDADFTGDGVFNFFDVSAFLNFYSAGCP
jgi:hypothetical protein